MTDDAAAEPAEPEKRVKKPRAKKPKAEAPATPSAGSLAWAAWAREHHHPRLSEEESCALMRRVFPRSRHHCRAEECPRACPRHPDFDEPPPPPAYSVPPPPMTAAELAAAERGLAGVRGLFARPQPPAETETGQDRPVPAPGDPSEEAAWAAAMVAWDAENASAPPEGEALVDEPADGSPSVAGGSVPEPAAGDVPAMSSPADVRGDIAGTLREPEPWKNGLPPCVGCGRHRAVMIAMRPPREGEKGYRICGRCYTGDRP